jgi:hypothetical protein
MNKSAMWAASVASLALVSFSPSSTADSTQKRVEYNAASERASALYKEANAGCEPLSGHEKDMCLIEAKAAE